MPRAFELTGWRFGKILVLGRSSTLKYGRVVWLCACDCGNFASSTTNKLRRHKFQSCGCAPDLNTGSTTKGLSRHPLYITWMHMMYRCHWPAWKVYKQYGGRGIYVCDEWRDFRNFIRDVGERPQGMTLDRIDNDGPYAPWNCRWATPLQQSLNRRNSRMITWHGRTQNASLWAKELGVHPSTVVRWHQKQAAHPSA